MADCDYTNLLNATCKHCNTIFSYKKHGSNIRLFCSQRCAKLSNKSIDKYFNCSECNKSFYRKVIGNKYAYIYCSHKCRKLLSIKFIAKKEKIDNEIKALRRIKRYKEKQYIPKPSIKIIKCKDCDKTFIHSLHKLGAPKTRCEECSVKNKKYYGNISKRYRKLRVKYQTKGKPFNPISVLLRDGWRCQLCGVSTPQSRRGKRYNNSPELDHIIPVSKGGEHSMQNTQCLCRRCNLMKSDKIMPSQSSIFNM